MWSWISTRGLRAVSVWLLVIAIVNAAGPAAVGSVAAAGDGEFTVDVEHENGDRAQEVNALVIYQDGSHYKTVENYPGVDLKYTVSDLPTGHDYTINAYIHDQYAGTTGAVTIESDKWWTIGDESSVSRTISVDDVVGLTPTAYYDDGQTPLEGATVRVKSHQDDPDGDGKVVWRSGTTGSDGETDPAPLWLYPTGDSGHYTVEVVDDGETVASERLDDLNADRAVDLTTSVSVPTYEVTVDSESGGSADAWPSGTVEKGTDVSVTADPDRGYRFDHWSGDYPSGGYSDPSIEVTMDEDKDLTAQFESIEGDLTVDVEHESGDRAQETNALVVWQDEVGGEPYRKIETYPGVDLPRTLSNLPGDHEYKVNAYIHDQYAGTTGWVTIEDSDVSRTVSVDDVVGLTPTAYYDDGQTPLEGATVRVKSHQDDPDGDGKVVWRSGTTGSDGETDPAPLWLYPTGDSGHYTVEVVDDGTRVGSRQIELGDDRTVGVTTSVEPDVDGEIVGYRSPENGSEYELDTAYDVTVAVKNTGDAEHTFGLRAQEPSGTEVTEATKTVTLDAGETGTVTFEQEFYGVYTPTRGFTHELHSGPVGESDSTEIDEESVTLERPPAGDVTVAFTDGQGSALEAEFTLRDAEGDVVRDGYGERIYRNLPAGEYTLTASEPGHTTRSRTFTLQAGEDRTVELALPSEDVDAAVVDRSFEVTSTASQYGAGEVVRASVEVENTGNVAHQFFVGFSARDQYGNYYDNGGSTGQFVDLQADETRTVTLEWTVPEHAYNGSYDLLSAVWYDYPVESQQSLDRSRWLEPAVDVRQEGARAVTDELADAVERYRSSGDATVGVMPRTTVDGEQYRIAVYMGSESPLAWSGVREDNVLFEAFESSPPGQNTEDGWKRLDVRQALVFEETDDGYQVVTDPGTVRAAARLVAPGAEPFDPVWRQKEPGKSDYISGPSYNDGYDPNEETVQNIKDVLDNRILQAAGQWDTWIESDTDRYYVAVSSMTSLRSESLISESLQEQLTTANTLSGAIDTATSLQATVEGREKRVVEMYVDLLTDYQTEVQDADVEKLDAVSTKASALGHVLDFVLAMSEYQVYSGDRIDKLETIQSYAESTDGQSLDPALVSAIEQVQSEHEDTREQFTRNFVEFLKDEAITTGGEWALRSAGSAAVTKFSSYLVSKGVITTASGAKLGTAVKGIGSQVLAGLAISDLLYNVGGVYDAATEARYAQLAAEDFDAVADDIRAERYGTGLDDDTIRRYRAADKMKKHALGTFWMANSELLEATWVDDAKAAIYDALGVSTNLDTRQEFYLERGQEAHGHAEWAYSPDSINRTVASIPEEVVTEQPKLTVEDEVAVGTVDDGATHTLRVTNDGDAELEIESVVTDEGIDTEVGRSTLSPGEETTLELTFQTSELASSFAETVTLATNAPASPTQVRVEGQTGSATTLSAAFEYTPTDVDAGETVTFDAGPSSGGVDGYEWDVDDDGTVERTTTTQQTTYAYDNPGTYNVTLTVTNGTRTNATTRTVTVETDDESGTVAVEITGTNEPTLGEPLTVDLTVQNTGETEATETLSVDAGDLGSNTTTVTLSGGESVTETLTLETSGDDPGTYTVEATAGDDGGDTAEVTVESDREPGFVSGQIVDTSNEAVGSTTVAVLDGDAVVATTESGDDGSYTVEVAPGTYTLRASKPGFATGESSVTVERGETTAADVVLQGETNRTTVRLAPVEQRVGIDQTSRYEVVVTGADDGIGSYEFVARVGETGTATITDATPKGTSGDGALSSVEVADDGTSATVLTAAADLTEGTTTTIATLAVEGVAPGTTDISLDDIVVGDSQSRGYTIENVSGASVTVEEMAPVVVGDQPATDPDGDGLYEDINGDGTFDIVDVSALFRNRNSDTIQNDPEGLDFNGDGIVDIVDISKLFDEA